MLLGLIALWFFVSIPLVFFGAAVGYKNDVLKPPQSVSQIPRFIPEQKWHMKPAVMVLSAGAVPFGAAFIELYFILSSLWLNKFYYVFGFFAIVFAILIVTCAEISIVLVCAGVGRALFNTSAPLERGGVPHHTPWTPPPFSKIGPLRGWGVGGGPPPRPLQCWATFSSGPSANQKFSLAPSALVSVDQQFCLAPSVPLQTQQPQTPPPSKRSPGRGGLGGCDPRMPPNVLHAVHPRGRPGRRSPGPWDRHGGTTPEVGKKTGEMGTSWGLRWENGEVLGGGRAPLRPARRRAGGGGRWSYPPPQCADHRTPTRGGGGGAMKLTDRVGPPSCCGRHDLPHRATEAAGQRLAGLRCAHPPPPPAEIAGSIPGAYQMPGRMRLKVGRLTSGPPPGGFGGGGGK